MLSVWFCKLAIATIQEGKKKCFLRVYFWFCASAFENVSKIKQLADLWLYEQASRTAQETENGAERVN